MPFYALLFPSLLRSFFFFFSSVVVPFSSFFLPTHPPLSPSLFLFFLKHPLHFHLIINSKVMIKQHSFQSSQSFTTSSFYSCNLNLSVHTQDSLVLHFFFHHKCRLNFYLFSLSLFFLLISFPSVFFFFLFCLPSFVLFSLPSFFFFLFLCCLLSFLCHCL
ncbi:hypothetical protein K457DRAFT_1237064 [Linnemannia elongata AG-77]|uniref:Uncharacterized protein n=1 Tax=Linnemannia elongata AG-77 TaxID=1314771 RepID=A0A197K169_9FUNG|nr:hypothetical protein K457DRAFT_1237064 [Linnemannia elongata AG-77]